MPWLFYIIKKVNICINSYILLYIISAKKTSIYVELCQYIWIEITPLFYVLLIYKILERGN